MLLIDVLFYGACAVFAISLGIVLVVYRREPLYDPRIMFTLASSLWLFIIHGYVVEFEGYLAAKPEMYRYGVELLSALSMGMMTLGYLAFTLGATLAMRMNVARHSRFRDYRALSIICVALIAIALCNFAANVALIAGGDVIQYIAAVSERTYQIANDEGITAVGYVLGVIGLQVLAYVLGARGASRILITGFLALLMMTLVMRFSQGRIFQTLVLLGTCYVSWAMGSAGRKGQHAPWYAHVHYVIFAGALGIGLYFLRLASRLNQMGISVSWDTASRFLSQIIHFAFERGNVPNFPIVFTIIDQMPSKVDFLYGKTLFNWVLYLIPKSILPPDYLISLRIKNMWYTDIQGGGLPPTAVGEWYANFGIAGVVVGMFAVGYVLGLLYKRARVSQSPYATVLWANLVFGFVVIYPKTDLSQVPAFSVLVVLSLWLFMWLWKSVEVRHRA